MVVIVVVILTNFTNLLRFLFFLLKILYLRSIYLLFSNLDSLFISGVWLSTTLFQHLDSLQLVMLYIFSINGNAVVHKVSNISAPAYPPIKRTTSVPS